MTRTLRTPFLLLIAMIFCAGASTVGLAASRRSRRAAAAAHKSSRQAKNERAERGRGRNRSARETRAERRERLRDERRDRRASREVVHRGGRPLSRRERLALARREAIERRRREEAARRAELARLAALARQRAIEQAMRNEVANDVAHDDQTGEDLEVRRAAVAALGNHIGTVVVMDPKTGRVYSIVNQAWAVRRGFKPCSTIKLVTGVAGLNEKVIDPIQEISLNTNQIDLTDALAFSNNGYFQNVGGHVGFDRMVGYARQLGLGERTGINHANEYPGRVPLFKTGYAVNHMSSHGDDFEITPVQLAMLASVFANGGTLLTPHLPRTPEENTQFKTEARRQLNLQPETLRRMLPGMVGAVNYGSGKKAYDPLQTIAGKTGTCIGDGGQWVGLFTSFAPIEDPRLAISVVMRGPDAHGHVAAAVAGNIYRALETRFGHRPGTPPPAISPDIVAHRPKVDAKTASEEDAEETAAPATDTADENPKVDKANADANGNSSVNVKRVLQPMTTKPADATTRPATKTSPVPNASPTPSAAPTAKPMGNERPRRVGSTSPQ